MPFLRSLGAVKTLKRIHRLPHLAARIIGSPLAVHPQKLTTILAVIGPRIGLALAGAQEEGEFIEVNFHDPEEDEEKQTQTGDVGVLLIEGSLVARGDWIGASSGLTSFEGIRKQLRGMLDDDSIGGIVLELDSFGGEVGGLFDLVDEIKAARELKPIFAVAAENAFSAAFALASAAEKLFVSRTAGVGSIGVVAVHTDRSGADRDEGVSFEFIKAGDKKVDGNSHEPLSDRARADIQSEVDKIFELLVETIGEHGRMTAQQARDTQAGLFFGQDAVDAGLADQLGNVEDAVAAMTARLAKKSKTFGNMPRLQRSA